MSSLLRCVDLKKLTIHPAQFTPRKLKMLPDWVEVIEKEAPLQLGG
jgi:hypothetical protein